MKELEHFLALCLQFLNGYTHNFGVAIILLTFLIRLCLFPLGIKQDRSMKQMREMQPEIAKLKVKFGDDKQGLQKAQMELYKKNQVNPLGGCLPLIIQLPIFWALYKVLRGGIIPTDATFLWWHLSIADKTMILPLINGVATFLQQKFTMSTSPGGDNPQMKMMLYGMPIMIFFISRQFAVGLLCYWITSTLCAFGQYYLVNYVFNKNYKPNYATDVAVIEEKKVINKNTKNKKGK
ncbi:MAG: YidC/Oxa1 family membrane protein insertase [Fusobacteria bacterium]|nr:YidC/Oxa1 family membrane protein insertase [Fusobacteriota bacterium]